MITNNIHSHKDTDQTDLLIINQHGGNSQFPPDIQKLFDPLGESFRDFLELERDVGVAELSDAVSKQVTDSGLHVVRIDFPFPRAIIDINRRPNLACSIPLPLEILAVIEKIHRESTNEILALIAKTNPRLVLDQHTMSPSGPFESPVLSLDDPESFDKHVKAWNFAARCGELRPTCIINGLSTNEIIGNLRLSHILHGKLGQLKLNPAFNKPFAPTLDRHQGHLFINDGRGVALDIPKDRITDTPRSQIDMAHLKISEIKVEEIANLIAQSILQTLNS